MINNFINDALKHIPDYNQGFRAGIEKCIELIDYHQKTFSAVYNKTDIAALKDVKISCEAMMERVLSGEDPDSTSDLM